MLLLGVVLVALFVLLLLAAVGALFSSRSATGRGPVGHDGTALDAARERYARGEISREEFLRIRDDLEGHAGGPT